MSSVKASNEFKDSSRRSPLDLTADKSLVRALYGREDTFNDDVLPGDAPLIAPREFYAAVVGTSVARSGTSATATQSPRQSDNVSSLYRRARRGSVGPLRHAKARTVDTSQYEQGRARKSFDLG